MKFTLKNTLQVSTLALGIAALSTSANAAVIFDFSSSNVAAVTALDDQFSGQTFTVTSGGDTLILTTALVTAPEYDGTPALTGSTSAARTNITSNGLSVDNRTITNTPYATLGGNTSESSSMNPDEIVAFTFDQSVTFTSIDFFGIGGTEVATVSIGGGTPFSFANGQSGDVFSDPFGAGFVVSAGTSVTFSGTVPADLAYSITNFEVEVIPEPSSTALLGLGGLALLLRRRK